MRVKANVNLGGAVNAAAGEEFEISNEAVLQDLLHQGHITPVESNPAEVARVMNLSGEQLAEQRAQRVTERTLEEQAYAEAVQVANNQRAAEVEEQRNEAIRQARSNADQKVQQQLKSEQQVKESQMQANQMQQEANVKRVIVESEARQNAAQQNAANRP
jgi:hypothetical protein